MNTYAAFHILLADRSNRLKKLVLEWFNLRIGRVEEVCDVSIVLLRNKICRNRGSINSPWRIPYAQVGSYRFPQGKKHCTRQLNKALRDFKLIILTTMIKSFVMLLKRLIIMFKY